MKKNYYEILEIDRNASTEVIEKAYKTLIKKYHPDLHENEEKLQCEKKIKLLNEAYEVISNTEKRKQYDLQLQIKENLNNQNTNSNNTSKNTNSDNINLNNNVNYNKYNQNNYNNYEGSIYQDIKEKEIQARMQAKKQRQYEEEYNRQIDDAINKAYHDAYIQDLKNRGYKIRYKKTLKDYLLNLFSLIITIFVLFILFQIPFVKNFISDNILFKTIVNSFESILSYLQLK